MSAELSIVAINYRYNMQVQCIDKYICIKM